MKIITALILALALAAPSYAANDSSAAGSTQEKADDNKTARDEKDGKAPEKTAEKQEESKDPNVFECQYYTVTLVPGWTAVTPPTENQGTVTSVFKSNNGGVAVMLVLGKLGGADAKTIADMFAEQFKAQKPPVAKNGQYTFTFLKDGQPCEAYVTSMDDIFMVTTISGNRKEAMNFIKKQVKSADYAQLLPQ